MPSRTEGGLQPARQPPQLITAHKDKVFNVLWEMKKNGRAKSTIDFTRKALRFIAKHVDIEKPDSVKELFPEDVK